MPPTVPVPVPVPHPHTRVHNSALAGTHYMLDGSEIITIVFDMSDSDRVMLKT